MRKEWETKRLSDFAVTVSTGPFGSVLHKSEYVDDGVPLVNPINMIDEGIVPDPSKLIAPDTKHRLSSYVLKTGDVVVARRGEIGRCAVVGLREDGWVCGTGSFFIRPLQTLDSQFLAHLIRSNGYREKLEQLSTGTTMKNLSNTALGDLPITVPPLAEQRRIVGVLEEAFAGLAAAQAHAEKNLQNARALFKSHLQSVFRRSGNGWMDKPLARVCTLINGRAYKKEEMLSAGKYPLLRVGNFFTNKDWYYSDLELPPDKYCETGDLLYAWSASFGPRIWEGGKVIYHYHIWKVVPIAPVVEKGFLLHLLEWDVDQIKQAHGTGTTMMHVGKASMEARVVPIAPLPEQRRIVEMLTSLRTETQRLESLYQQKQAALTALKKSLLHQAFAGNL